MGIAEDIYAGSGCKPAAWPSVGTTYEGTMTQIRSKQCESFGTGILETWPNGDPKMTPILTVQTTRQDDAEDSGERDIYLRGGSYTAFGAALREAYSSTPSDNDIVGATIKIRYSEAVPSKYGTPRKIYQCRVTPKPSSAVAAAYAAGGDVREDRTPPPPPPPADDVPF